MTSNVIHREPVVLLVLSCGGDADLACLAATKAVSDSMERLDERSPPAWIRSVTSFIRNSSTNSFARGFQNPPRPEEVECRL